MTNKKQVVLLGLVAAIAATIGVVSQRATQPEDTDLSAIAPAAAASPVLMAARFPDIDGKPQALEQWRGKVLVVNFWATWCGPCRKEIPEFIKAQTELGGKGLQIVGIAIDANDKVKPYAAQMKMNYPVLVGEADAIEVARQAGDQLGGLPFTVIIDRQGQAIKSHLGPLDKKKLEAIVLPLL